MSGPEALSDAIDQAAADYLRAGRWASGFARGKMSADPVYAAVLSEIPETGADGLLVDVGCGEGYLLALVRRLRPALTLYGVDHDERRVGIGRRALDGQPALTLAVDDARSAALPRADYCACLDMLHYLAPPEQDALIQRMASRLAPGGALLVRDGSPGDGLRPALTRWSEQLLVRVGRHRGDGVFMRPTQALVAALEGCGLTVDARPCQQGTPFSNVLLVARRDG